MVAALSLAQSTLMALGNMFFLGVQVAEPLLYLLCFWVAGLVFVFIIYTLVSTFANLGKAIAVLLLIVQVTGCGGSYPLSLLPGFVQALSPWLPATHALEAMRAAMPWVGGLYLGLIAVGEANGALPRMFSYCVGLMESRRKLRNEIIRALTYPAIVVLMGLGVGYYVSTVAIPQIASVMGNPDALPPITRSLLTTSDWVKTQGYWLILGPVLFGVTVAVLRHVPGVGLALDRVGLSIPLFGKVGRFSGNALFNQTLAILLESGISVIESLALIRGTLSNAFYRRQIAAVRASVLAGKPLSEGIAASALNHLSPLSKALVRVGESSGNLAEGLRYVGDFYAQALARRLDLLGKLVEPALVVVVGGMVAYVYIAFFMGMAAMNATAG